MGFDDSDFSEMLIWFPTPTGKGNATLYELVGNSIVVPVFETLFEQLLLAKPFENKEVEATAVDACMNKKTTD